jgi:hypothetical protein
VTCVFHVLCYRNANDICLNVCSVSVLQAGAHFEFCCSKIINSPIIPEWEFTELAESNAFLDILPSMIDIYSANSSLGLPGCDTV